MSQPGVASSPAIVTISNDFIDKMLGGNAHANIAEASVVAGLYFLFLLLSLFNLIRERIGTHGLLVLFCAIRVVAFSIRAYMQNHLTQNLAITYEVFFAVGFVFIVKLLVSLLYSWTLPTGVPLKRGIVSFGILRNHGTIQERFITILLMAGMVTSIIGATDAYTDESSVKDYNKGLKLMKAGYTIYLVAIVLYDIAVITGPLLNRLNFGRPRSMQSATLIVLALEVAGLLITCKAVFQVIAIYTNPSLTFRNRLFYPLEVLPELLVLCIVCVPGFIQTVYRGSHAHPETDTTHKAAGEHFSPDVAESDGVRPTTPTTTHTNGTAATSNGAVPASGTTATHEPV